MPGPAYTTTKHAVLALTHSFNMDECVNGLRACCLSPGEVATPILKSRPVVPSEEEQAKMLQPEDCGRTIAFVASLPPRQREVLQGMARGLLNKQIAWELKISEKTVKMHRALLMERLGVPTSADLIRLAVEAGL